MKKYFSNTSFNYGPWFIAIAAIMWTTDIMFRVNLEPYATATQIVFVDHLIILLVISPFIVKWLPDLRKFNSYDWISILFVGIGGSALASIFLTTGFFIGSPFQYVGIVIFMQQTQPLFAFFLAHVLLKERLPKNFYPLAGLSILSVILIVSPYFFGQNGSFILFNSLLSQDGFIAAMCGLMAAFLWGSSTVFGRYILQHGNLRPSYFQMAGYRFLIAGVFLALFIPFYNESKGYPSINTLLNPVLTVSFLYLALVVGLFSLVLYYYGLRSTHASISTIAELAYPLSYYLVALPLVGFLGTPDIIQLLGGIVLIVSSTILSINYGKISFNNQEPDLTGPIPS